MLHKNAAAKRMKRRGEPTQTPRRTDLNAAAFFENAAAFFERRRAVKKTF